MGIKLVDGKYLVILMTDMTPLLWKALNESDDKKFRDYARKNYVVGAHVDLLSHPVYLHECYLMNRDAGILKSE
jgi:hypothetical protein